MIIFFFAKIGALDAFRMLFTFKLYRSYTHDHKYNGFGHNNICIYILSKFRNKKYLKYKCMKVKDTWFRVQLSNIKRPRKSP